MFRLGISGARPLGASATLISGTEGGLGVVFLLGISAARLREDSAGIDATFISGTEGGLGVVFRLGTAGARPAVGAPGAVAACWRGGGLGLDGLKGRGVRSGTAEISSFISMTFQSFLKETIGRPGASETAVGVGSF